MKQPDWGRGRVEVLEVAQWLPRRPDEVFEFYADPFNLERITPDLLRFRVVRASTARVESGTLIDYRLHLHGIPFHWRSRIDCWEPGRCFVDRQVRGPYALWHHRHEFESRDGGTTVRDVVHYRLPFGRFGALLAGPWVARDLGSIFDYRRRATAAILGAPPAASVRVAP